MPVTVVVVKGEQRQLLEDIVRKMKMWIFFFGGGGGVNKNIWELCCEGR